MQNLTPTEFDFSAKENPPQNGLALNALNQVLNV